MAKSRFQRYVDGLTDDEVRELHRIVSRRAAAIYRPLYTDKWTVNSAAAQSIYYGSSNVGSGGAA